MRAVENGIPVILRLCVHRPAHVVPRHVLHLPLFPSVRVVVRLHGDVPAGELRDVLSRAPRQGVSDAVRDSVAFGGERLVVAGEITVDVELVLTVEREKKCQRDFKNTDVEIVMERLRWATENVEVALKLVGARVYGGRSP